jgi:hypothetical protein
MVVMMMMVMVMVARVIMCLAGIMSPGSNWSEGNTNNNSHSGKKLLQDNSPFSIPV